MADFQPFRGLRYDPTRVDLAQVLCPPYDVIKGASRDSLIARDPHNIVQVELAARYGEAATPEQYEHSAHLLQQWMSEGVLKRDDTSFYLYEQEFEHPTKPGTRLKRRGVLGALTLEEFGAGVQPHEHTLSGPKADRLNLLRATQTNTSPIFGLVGDDDGWIDGLLTDVALSPATAEATDADGIVHRLWKITDDETVNGLEAAFDNESILIADGHHRYETALNYWRESGEEADGTSSVLMMCVSSSDDGLIVLPTHRVIKNVDAATIQELPRRLTTHWEVSPFGGDALTLAAALEGEADAPTKLGLVLPQGSFLLTVKEGEATQAALDASKSAAYNGLNVTLLHRLILENELGIDADKLAAGEHIAYTIHAVEAAQKVQGGEAQAAFLLGSTPVAQVQAVAQAGDKMPQKSTYFYPKLVTGLVLRPLHS